MKRDISVRKEFQPDPIWIMDNDIPIDPIWIMDNDIPV